MTRVPSAVAVHGHEAMTSGVITIWLPGTAHWTAPHECIVSVSHNRGAVQGSKAIKSDTELHKVHTEFHRESEWRFARLSKYAEPPIVMAGPKSPGLSRGSVPAIHVFPWPS
jgi:hypothetical protein